MNHEITKVLSGILTDMGVQNPRVNLEHPENSEHGDISSNVALAHAKELGMAPRALSEKIVEQITNKLGGVAGTKERLANISKVSIAGPGFINFYLEPSYIAMQAVEASADKDFGRSKLLSGKKVLIEYTDPNAFKVFHIGHLMSNSIGESLSRIIANAGANVVRMCYPSDIGLHIAKAVWAIKQNISQMPTESAAIVEKTDFLGKMYVLGTAEYEASEKKIAEGVADPVKADIDAINKKLFEKSDKELNDIYENGRRWSLEHFEELYKKLGTKFDAYIYESEVSEPGKQIVLGLAKAGKVFEESEGAIVFKGENYGLHTRVFVNSKGLPTYEAKEIGLNTKKFDDISDIDTSIIVTASEQNEYFKVIRKALELIDPKIGERTRHVGHGMLRKTTGKMSSRKGDVITGESLIASMEDMTLEKMANREMTDAEKKVVATEVAIGAIRYSILRQAPGGDIIYDPEKSISFEGDSGPYLQYATVRANTVLEKAKAEGAKLLTPSHSADVIASAGVVPGQLERMITRFPEIAERACAEYAPQLVTGYLTELAGLFNAFYANNKIIDAENPQSSYRLAVTQAFSIVMKNGLNLIGISVPAKM